ncbi:MAG: D-2-hydroxyacid dehydrogenase [Oscillospiraceae bacterium]|nr:D-2-hydroxyacid dehydrogenase [Oscillospiraceae bacterium]
MKLIILDGFAENPGDLSWDWLKNDVDDYRVYDITPKEKIVERCAGADIVVTNKTPITAETIEALPELKFISTLSTGYNVIDIAAARKANVPVSNIPAYSTDGVAQLVFAFMLEMANHVALHNDSVKSGDWVRSEHFCYWKAPISELAGKTMGIIGFGKIGSAVAQIANAFGMKVIAYSPNTRSYSGFGRVDFLSMDEVVSQSDFLSLHCPLTEETNGLVDMNFLKKMKPTAYLINTSRGQVICEQDLRKALDEGVIAGAGLDVLCVEPARSDNPLLDCDKCLITPHIAWASFEARSRLMDIFRGNIEAFLKGQPVNVVN